MPFFWGQLVKKQDFILLKKIWETVYSGQYDVPE